MAKSDEALRLLTPKQRRVYEYLKQGHKPPQIAKSMKVTRSSVYNHVRNIRRLGVTLPGEEMPARERRPATANNAGATAANANTNGAADPVAALKAATEIAQERQIDIAEEIASVRDREKALEAERGLLTDLLGRYERAAKELVG